MSKQLKAAIEANDPEQARVAVKKVKDLNRKMAGSTTPLLLACQLGADKVVDVLLDAGADGKGEDRLDNPFLIALEQGQPAIAEKLAARFPPDDEFLTLAIENAIAREPEASMCYLLDRFKPPITAHLLHLALLSKGTAKLKALLERGADITLREDSSEFGTTVVHQAASGGDLPHLEMLFEYGADPNIRDNYGRTPPSMVWRS